MPRGAFALSLGGWATWAGLGILACRIKGQGHTWYCKGSETSCHNNAMFHTSLVQGFDDVLQHLCLLLLRGEGRGGEGRGGRRRERRGGERGGGGSTL